MDEKLIQELLDEFLPTLEALETTNTAIIQFLRGKRIIDDEQLAPYVEQAARASDVKWRATRLRLNHLISSTAKAAERVAEKESANAQKESEESPASKKEGEHSGKIPEENKERHKFVNVNVSEKEQVKPVPAAQEQGSGGKNQSEPDEKAKQDAA